MTHIAWRLRHRNDGPHMWEYYPLPVHPQANADIVTQPLTLSQLLDILNDDRHANAQERPPEPHPPLGWASDEAKQLLYPRSLTSDLKTVLSTMLWNSGNMAELLRAGGESINRRAEDEQAHVLHWLIVTFLEHGDDYRTVAIEHLRKCEVARTANQADGAAT